MNKTNIDKKELWVPIDNDGYKYLLVLIGYEDELVELSDYDGMFLVNKATSVVEIPNTVINTNYSIYSVTRVTAPLTIQLQKRIVLALLGRI